MSKLFIKLSAALLVSLAVTRGLFAAPLSDSEVDRYNTRVGTQTFSGLYSFTSDTLLVETANAIQGLGTETIKFYLGPNFPDKYRINLGPNITNLVALARDEPSVHHVLDMPFHNFIAWVYPISYWWPFDGYSASERASEYKEFYDLTRYVLTNYNNSGKTFYFGHWEGDGYLSVTVNGKAWATNPSPTMVQGFIDCLNNRQKAIDDAKRDTTFTNVNVFCYAEANRVRDAMVNGPTNNIRMMNAVVPYVTNLDYVSYSSYDAQNLSSANLYATLDYMEARVPTNKASVISGERIWIGEYGWGSSQTAAQQEPTTRAYFQRLLNYPNHALPYILFWEIYDNEANTDGSPENFYLIDPNGAKAPCWYLHQRLINSIRLLAAQFKESNGRVPDNSEFLTLINPLLNQPLPTPVNLGVTNVSATILTNNSAVLAGLLAQGVYGDDEAAMWVYFGRQDGDTNPAAWESSRFAGVNAHFNPTTFAVTVNGLASNTNFYFRFYAANSTNSAWAPSSATFTTKVLSADNFGSRMKISFTGYNRSEPLANFPALINLGTNLPGFSYHQFASPTGGDLRFAAADGLTPLAHEIDEWNTNGISRVWVQMPLLSGTNDFCWAYWGNPLDPQAPPSNTNGAVWSPNFQLVWHLKESGFPFADSALQHPAISGTAPTSAPGQIGRGVSINGTSQYLNAGTVSLGNAFTLSTWLKLDPTATDIQAIWANKSGGWNSDGFALFVDSYQTSDRMLRLETGDGVGGTAAASATGAVSTGQWHLIAASIDRAAGSARLYLDGADITQSSSVDTSFNNLGLVDFAQITNGGFHFKGTMDEARIENLARSSNWVWASWMTAATNGPLQSYSAIIPQIPTLAMDGFSGGSLALSWPASGVGYVLLAATNLAAPIAWLPITNLPVWTNNQWQVVLPPDQAANHFYRLQFR